MMLSEGGVGGMLRWEEWTVELNDAEADIVPELASSKENDVFLMQVFCPARLQEFQTPHFEQMSSASPSHYSWRYHRCRWDDNPSSD